jgi:tryptophan-rich sensory protein
MQVLFQARRSVALFCLAALLIAALIPAASGLAFGILVPLWIFVAAIATFSIRRTAGDSSPLRVSCVPVLPSRAPPIA